MWNAAVDESYNLFEPDAKATSGPKRSAHTYAFEIRGDLK
jgi:hypothetical protein